MDASSITMTISVAVCGFLLAVIGSSQTTNGTYECNRPLAIYVRRLIVFKTKSPAVAMQSRPYRLRPKPSAGLPVTKRKQFLRGDIRCSKIRQAYKKMQNEERNVDAKMFFYCTDIVIFVVRHLSSAHCVGLRNNTPLHFILSADLCL